MTDKVEESVAPLPTLEDFDIWELGMLLVSRDYHQNAAEAKSLDESAIGAVVQDINCQIGPDCCLVFDGLKNVIFLLYKPSTLDTYTIAAITMDGYAAATEGEVMK